MIIKNLHLTNLVFFLFILIVGGRWPSVVCQASSLKQEAKWQLKSKEDGINIYKTTAEDSGTGLVPIKLSTILDAPLLKVITIMDQTDLKTQWIPKLMNVSTVEKLSLLEKIEYSLYDAPWPFDNRDFVSRLKATYDVKKGEVYVAMSSVDHPKWPAKKENVRAHTHWGDVLLKDVGGKTYFEMSLLNNMKGYMPVWIMNMVKEDWPTGFVKGLRKQLKKDVKINPKFLKIWKKTN